MVVSAVVAPVPTVVDEDDVTPEVETTEVDDGCGVVSVETCVVEPSITNIGLSDTQTSNILVTKTHCFQSLLYISYNILYFILLLIQVKEHDTPRGITDQWLQIDLK